jgi:hypothetical protein
LRAGAGNLSAAFFAAPSSMSSNSSRSLNSRVGSPFNSLRTWSERAQDILRILRDFKDGDTRRVKIDGNEEETVVSRIYPTTHFGFRKITVERPLRLNFQASPERITGIEEEKGFQGLGQSKKKGAAGAHEAAEGRALQGRRGRHRRLRDQFQPLFLPLQAATPLGGDRGRHSRRRVRALQAPPEPASIIGMQHPLSLYDVFAGGVR